MKKLKDYIENAPFWKLLPAAMLGAALILGGMQAVFSPSSARAQNVAAGSVGVASGQVAPRIYAVLSNVLMAPKGNSNSMTITNTNNFAALLGPNWPTWLTNQNVYVEAPTLLMAGSVHEISLTCFIQETNVMAGASNLVITVYPAYDITGGNPNIVGQRYGQLFNTNFPLLTWTISYSTNGQWGTNIPVGTWCPATAVGYTINNQNNSNIVVTLLQADIP